MSKEFDGKKHSFSFLPPLERTFDVFHIYLIHLENSKVFIDQQFHFQIQQGDANGNGISNAFDINNSRHILL